MDGRWRVLTCHRQVIHYAPFKFFSIVETKNKVSEVKGLDSRGGVPPAWSPAVERRLGERTCPSADGRWRVLTCHRQVIHYAPFKFFSIVETKNKVSEVKGLDSRGGVPPAWSPAVETVHRTVSLYRLCSSPLD